MITEALLALVVSVFIRLCRPTIIRQAKGVHYEYVYGIGISETGDCISYIRFAGKGCKETGRITDYFRGDRDGTTVI